MDTLTVIALQFSVAEGNIEANIRKVNELGSSLDRHDPKIVILPEMWASGFDYAKIQEHALMASCLRNQMMKWASIWNAIIIGSIAEVTEGEKIVNRAYVIDPSEQILGFYDKIHLFSPHGEDMYFHRGSHIFVIKTSLCSIGVITCYDLRFPELSRIIAMEGATMLCVPALWPSARLDHWRVLLRARAIENQIFVAGCNGCGKIGGMFYPGASAIIDPWGKVLREGGGTEEIVSAPVNMKAVEDVRAKIPCFSDRVDPKILRKFSKKP